MCNKVYKTIPSDHLVEDVHSGHDNRIDRIKNNSLI